MAIKTRAIKIGPVLVRGLKVSKNNVGEFAAFIRNRGGDAEAIYQTKNGKIDDRVKLKTKQGWRVARIGDVIIRGSEGHIFGVIKADAFPGYVK